MNSSSSSSSNDKGELVLAAEYDSLAIKYNKVVTDLEGATAHNEYLQNEVDSLKVAVEALEKAGAKLINRNGAAPPQPTPTKRDPDRGYWIKFDLTNLELTRPLINFIMRAKDRPKQFYLEIIGDDVIEVSETKQ